MLGQLIVDVAAILSIIRYTFTATGQTMTSDDYDNDRSYDDWKQDELDSGRDTRKTLDMQDKHFVEFSRWLDDNALAFNAPPTSWTAADGVTYTRLPLEQALQQYVRESVRRQPGYFGN